MLPPPIDWASEVCEAPGCELPAAGSDPGRTAYCAGHLEVFSPGGADHMMMTGRVMVSMQDWVNARAVRRALGLPLVEHAPEEPLP